MTNTEYVDAESLKNLPSESQGLANAFLSQSEVGSSQWIPPENSADFVNTSKARFRRRLQDRWHCQTLGHTYCFTTTERMHIPLSEDDMELWASALHNGEATLLIPPKNGFELGTTLIESDDIPFRLVRPSSIIQYQRPFRLQSLNATLPDLRSMQARLRVSDVSSCNSGLSTSTGSSGVPGIGYLSGKAVKWVGMQMLDMFVPLEISRRRRVIIGLIKQLEKIPDHDRSRWILKRKHSISRAVEDLLELTTDLYKEHYRITAIEQGVRLRSLFASSFREPYSEESTHLCLMCVKLFPLFLLSNDNFSAEEFAGALRETLLQESSDLVDERPLIAEIAGQLCFELAYGSPSPWRVEGYNALCDVYNTAHGSQSLQHLGRSGPLMDDLVRTSLTNPPQPISISEHARAVHFFAIYGNDMPEYRMHLFSPTGIPLSIEHLKSIRAEFATNCWEKEFWNLCEEFAAISGFGWCIALLVRCDICATLVSLLIFTQNINSAEGSWEGYDLIWTLRNLTVYGGDSGRQAVLDATTDDLRRILPHIGEGVRRFWGDAIALETEELIAETWQ